MSDILYYSIAPLINKGAEINAPFVAAIGGKGNGKTFSSIGGSSDGVCFGIRGFFKTGKPFVYLRRMVEMITKKNIQTLLNPHLQDIINLSKGKYNKVTYAANVFYLCHDTNKNVKPVPICYTRALSTLESQTGADLGAISCIIYDEFLSRERELPDEFRKIMIAHSNFIRNRSESYTPFILLGNTFTRNSTLLQQFGINSYDLKEGDIIISKSRQGEVRLLLEYCSMVTVQENAYDTYYKRFDNDTIKMITHGSWVMNDYPALMQNMEKKEKFYRVAFVGNSSQGRIDCDLFIDNNRLCVFVNAPYKDKKVDLWVTGKPMTRDTDMILYNISALPIFQNIAKCMATNAIYCDFPESVERLRDILTTIHGGDNLRKYLK